MSIVRWINVIYGVSLVLVTLIFLGFLPGNVAGYDREPEDLWLGLIWISLLCVLASLCFINACRLGKSAGFGWLTLSNLAVVTLLTLLLAIGRNDPAVPPILALCALGPVATLIGIWRISRAPPS